MNPARTASLAVLLAAAGVSAASAQTIGTFRWQLQPYCNVLTVTITQVGGVYRLEGRDDQCGAARAASVIGTAFQNPDGSIGLGFNIVSAPAGVAQPISAAMSLATLSGTWLGTGGSGPFVFTPGVGTGGAPRPAPSTGGGGTVIPAAFSLANDGGFLAGGTLNTGAIPASGAGVRLMWHPRKAAIRAGLVNGTSWDDAQIGSSSAAFNLDTQASGAYSFAANYRTVARETASAAFGIETASQGIASLAGGQTSVASGDHAVALGLSTYAAGAQSVALGRSTSAYGARTLVVGHNNSAYGDNSLAGGRSAFANAPESLAFGYRVIAYGNSSVVLGTNAEATLGAHGSFVFGDQSTVSLNRNITAFIPNQFLVRAAGGVGFYTNTPDRSTAGVELAINGSQWLVVSDVNAKQAFKSLDGEEVLAKLAGMPIQEWSYKAQHAAIRHVGPTAQDFSAAFGLGEDPLRIGTLDADGIALRAIQALEARTQSLMRENQDLRDRLAALEAQYRQR